MTRNMCSFFTWPKMDLKVVKSVPELKVLPYKKCGDVHEKFYLLENTRFKALAKRIGK